MDNENGREHDHTTNHPAQPSQLHHTSQGNPSTSAPAQSTSPAAVVPPQAAAPPPAAVPYPTTSTAPLQAPLLAPAAASPPAAALANIPPYAVPPQAGSRPRTVDGPEVDTTSIPEARREAGRDRMAGPLPPLPFDPRTASEVRVPPRSRTVDTHQTLPVGRPRSEVDWIVPIEEKAPPRRTIGERLEPTVARALVERDKYAMKAKMTGYALNAAIGLQVLLGSLTTGLSAAATTGKQAAVATTILGGLSTLVASYLARARGSNEPELSITRVKDLEQFIRECHAFQLDSGHVVTAEYDEYLFRLRARFEELLGNASGERKLSPPV